MRKGESGRKAPKEAPKRASKKAPKKARNALLRPALFFGIAAALLIGVLLVPSPKDGKLSGVELYGEDPEVEVYGPELPESTVGSYPVPVVESVVLPEDADDGEETIYVYASDDQECYHLPTCKFAYASGHKFTIAEARLLGYKPCPRCEPPTE